MEHEGQRRGWTTPQPSPSPLLPWVTRGAKDFIRQEDSLLGKDFVTVPFASGHLTLSGPTACTPAWKFLPISLE
ncbi:hypothetical protein VULLAG_LOCUS17491 [Vulpes lagopus]